MLGYPLKQRMVSGSGLDTEHFHRAPDPSLQHFWGSIIRGLLAIIWLRQWSLGQLLGLLQIT